MNNQHLLNMRLENLQKVNRDLEVFPGARMISIIQRKRADITMRTYGDLSRKPRYSKAVSFLADDLLGGNNLGRHGSELVHARKPMIRMLPDSLLGTVARSVEFTAVTLNIELQLAQYLVGTGFTGNELSDEDYLEALRSAVPKELFETQFSLIVLVGEEIESVVHRPFVATALKMCRTPAYLMGLSSLQNFLERGFDAFRSMRGSQDFIRLFSIRESELISRIYTTQANPFVV